MEEQKNLLAKASTSWLGLGAVRFLDRIGIHSWSDFLALVTTIYTLFLITDWVYKKYLIWKNS